MADGEKRDVTRGDFPGHRDLGARCRRGRRGIVAGGPPDRLGGGACQRQGDRDRLARGEGPLRHRGLSPARRDFVWRGDGFPALVDAMDLSGVSRAVIFGLGIAKQWDEDTGRAPKYYLSNDSRCYYYSGTDFIVAEELLAQPAAIRDRFLHFCCGVNGNDRFAAEHIRQLLRLYPKFWRGIGEIMSRHDDLTALTYGEPPHIDHLAFKDLFDLGAEEGLPVLIHHNRRCLCRPRAWRRGRRLRCFWRWSLRSWSRPLVLKCSFFV